MVAFPTAAQVNDVENTVAEQQQAFADWLNATLQLLGSQAETTLTIASGSATPTRGCHAIDTEGAAASDDLTNLATTNLPDGNFLLIRCANASRVVTVKYNAGGAGQIALADGLDFVMNSLTLWLLLKRTSSNWEEVLRGGRQVYVKGADVASAATLAIPAVGDYFVITGTTTVTALSAAAAGREVVLRFGGALQLTHHATNLILLGGANITTAAGDIAVFRSEGGGSWRMTNYRIAASGIGGGTVTSISATEGVATGDGNPITGSGSLKLDVDGLTEDATPDQANDYVATWDASGGAHKKAKLVNLLTTIDGGTY